MKIEHFVKLKIKIYLFTTMLKASILLAEKVRNFILFRLKILLILVDVL